MKSQPQKIAIIGGGWTGLVAAYRLAQKGHKVILYEKSDILGGLAGGFYVNGTSLEKAYHHIFKTDRDIINLAHELRLDDKLLWKDSSVCTYYGGKFYSFGGAVDLLKFSAMSLVSRLRTGFVMLYLKFDKNWQKYQSISAKAWMQKWCGDEAMKVIWLPLLEGKFDYFSNQISMAWLWARLHIRANSRKAGEGEKLGYFNGGFQIITDELQRRLIDLGVQIRLRSNISHICNENGVTIVCDDNGTVTKDQFEKVVACIPSNAFSKLIENLGHTDYLQKLNSIDYIGAVCLIFTSKQKFSQYYWHNINDKDSPFLVFINHTNLMPKECYGGEYVYYLGKYAPHDSSLFNMSNEQIQNEWFKYFKKLFSDFDESKVKSVTIFKFKNAQHIVDQNYQQKIPDYKTPINGVYLANFSQIYPEDRGTNFAVREGNKIAEIL